eukprot:42562-Eustigmatos_ZCMA.PRE.1
MHWRIYVRVSWPRFLVLDDGSMSSTLVSAGVACLIHPAFIKSPTVDIGSSGNLHGEKPLHCARNDGADSGHIEGWLYGAAVALPAGRRAIWCGEAGQVPGWRRGGHMRD